MVTDITRIFGCPNCGYRVSESDESCPRCKKALSRDAALECPFCGELVDPRLSSCPSCGVDYSDFKERMKSKAGQRSVDELLSDIMDLESMKVEQTAEDYAFQCPNCGATVSSDATSCPECGTNFELIQSQIGPPPPMPPAPEPMPDLPPPQPSPGPMPEPEEPEEDDEEALRVKKRYKANLE